MVALKEKKLSAKLKECKFIEVSILGHVVNKNGLVVDPTKVKTRTCTCAYTTHGICWVCCLHKCITIKVRMRPHASRLGCGLCFKAAVRSWEELSYSWFRISSSCLCSKEMEGIMPHLLQKGVSENFEFLRDIMTSSELNF